MPPRPRRRHLPEERASSECVGLYEFGCIAVFSSASNVLNEFDVSGFRVDPAATASTARVESRCRTRGHMLGEFLRPAANAPLAPVPQPRKPGSAKVWCHSKSGAGALACQPPEAPNQPAAIPTLYIGHPAKWGTNPPRAWRMWLVFKYMRFPARAFAPFSLYRSCTRSRGAAWPASAAARSCGPRQKSMYETWCAHATVQRGAHAFAVRYSRAISSSVYSASGFAG